MTGFDKGAETSGRTPWWFLVLLLVTGVPELGCAPVAADAVSGYFGSTGLPSGWLFPLYDVLSVVCAYLCYPSRRSLAWILLALQVLIGVALLTLMSVR